MTSCEIWRDVPGYGGLYRVSNLGRIWSTTSRRLLKPWKQNAGYLCVTLFNNKKWSKQLVHRLVADAFIPAQKGKTQINHINGIKTDNRLENLERCNTRENAMHSIYKLGNDSQFQKRPVMCLDTMQVYASASEAARAVHGCNQNIVKCCQGKRLSHKGLRWAYAEVEQ